MLSTLAPCVLPLLPVAAATALARHRLGPVALAAGLAAAFAAVGVFVATAGYPIGLDGSWFRRTAAILLVFLGATHMSAQPRGRLAPSGARLPAAGRWLLAPLKVPPWSAELAAGVLLGAVWVPSVGPTLGKATLLAVQHAALPQVGLLMLVFGLGAAAPLVALGLLLRGFLPQAAAERGAALFGALLVAVGALVLTGLETRLEALAVEHSPPLLIDLATAL